MEEALFSFRPLVAQSFIYSDTHIRAHITTQAHLWYNHLEPGYHGDMVCGGIQTYGERLPSPRLTTLSTMPPPYD
ncbi:hypothetical protein E2C01_084257 [Portunus trituberculatus]|uniref:Uncharacterized protein n=1 Tax=Portunus trituberculatus TaxID=210409 RepID=A0A5B7J6Z2_PORTR|nr:hypothetical protein [Portunus trituberculatus]